MQDERKEEKTDSSEGEPIFQHKVSYATPLLVLLQVTNYCILISMLPEQEGGGECGMRREERREGNGGAR